MSEWQPIETAPMYGGNFVLLTGGEPDRMHWDDDPIPPVVASYYTLGGWVLASYDSDMATIYYENPTHWMRLPERPHCLEDLTRPEMRLLKLIAASSEPSSWNPCLASLFHKGYINAPFDGRLTDKGKKALGMLS